MMSDPTAEALELKRREALKTLLLQTLPLGQQDYTVLVEKLLSWHLAHQQPYGPYGTTPAVGSLMPESTPDFTLEHEEQTWRVSLSQGEKHYAIYLTRFGTGNLSVRPFPDGKGTFWFNHSDPNVLLIIGRLFIAAARKAGATDA